MATRAQHDGREAEERAARYLAAQGLDILARNYRTRLGEIDLVARDGATLVFVEVRRRADSEAFGGAVGSIDGRKRRRLEAAARHYLSRLAEEPTCRFDVIAMQGNRCTWLRDAFGTA